MTKQAIYSEEFLLEASDFAHLLQLFLEVLTKHDEEINAHWDEQYERVLSPTGRWIVTQYHIEIKEMPLVGVPVRVTTRVTAVNRFFVTRYFELYQEGVLKVQLYGQYAGLNFEERKMESLNVEGLHSLDIIDSSIKVKFPRLPKIEGDSMLEVAPYKAQAEDIDRNQHVNNARYPLWCLEQIDPTYYASHDLCQVDIRYKQEVLEGEELLIVTKWLTPLISLHSIRRAADNEELTIIQFEWKER